MNPLTYICSSTNTTTLQTKLSPVKRKGDMWDISLERKIEEASWAYRNARSHDIFFINQLRDLSLFSKGKENGNISKERFEEISGKVEITEVLTSIDFIQRYC